MRSLHGSPNMPSAGPIDRRRFIRIASTSFGALAAASLTLPVACSSDPTAPDPDDRPRLVFPPTRTPSGITLEAAATTVALGSHDSVPAWTYDGTAPGPTLRASRGAPFDVSLANALGQATNVHWHGMIVPHDMDGHPADVVQPGMSRTYGFPISQRAGAYWYHPHPHVRTGEQIYRGLAGLLLVEDDEERTLQLPTGAFELPLVIRDAEVDDDGRLRYRRNASGFLGNFPLINGVAWPAHAVERAMYRVRVLNAANRRVFRVARDDGRPFTLIGNDGGLLPRSEVVSAVDLAPAERVDLLLDFRATSPGRRVGLRCLRAGWDLLLFNVGEAETSSEWKDLPPQLSAISPLVAPPDVRTRTFVFEGNHRINDREFEMHRVDFTVPLGAVERWRFVADSGGPHPVHVHGTQMQIESRTGGRNRIEPWERGWKDTVMVENGETVTVLLQFERHRGVYLLHCHRLEHEDGGMMLNFEVV